MCTSIHVACPHCGADELIERGTSVGGVLHLCGTCGRHTLGTDLRITAEDAPDAQILQLATALWLRATG